MSLERQRRRAAAAISKQTGVDIDSLHICMADDMHPYNCDGMFGGTCIHCERKVEAGHDPEKCALCNWDNDEDV